MGETASKGTGRISPLQARLVLGATVGTIMVLVWISLGIGEPPRRPGLSDLDIYQRVVEALRGGQGYYPALHDALLAGGYGTLSPLNWRPPLFLTFLSLFPTLEAAQVFLALVTLVAWLMGVALAYRRGGVALAIWAAIAFALSLISIIAYRAELSFELCAGTLILISVAAYGLGWRWAGVAVGVLALFVRELAVLYVLVCLIMSLRERRWAEAIAWVIALAAYAGFYAWHWAQLSALIGPADHAAATDWLQFGGLTFVLRTAAFNGVLLALPYGFAAVALVLGLLGLKDLPRSALTVVLYLLLFLVYGRPQNEYWGAVYAPLITLGLVLVPGVISGLVARARAQ